MIQPIKYRNERTSEGMDPTNGIPADCQCGESFQVNPSTEENLYLHPVFNSLMAECPACGARNYDPAKPENQSNEPADDGLLFIPSLGRANWEILHTLNQMLELDAKWLARTRLVVPSEELNAYAQVCKDVDLFGKGLALHACPLNGIGATRQWILDNSGSRYVLMFDDDMRFYRRESKSQGETTLRTLTSTPEREFITSRQDYAPASNEFDTMCDLLVGWMKSGIAHVGISARQGNNHEPDLFKEVTRQNNCHGFDRDVLAKHDIKFTRLPVMEDFDVTLSLLRRGFINRVTYDFAWNQRGSGKEGGCSTYRTGEVQAKAAHMLQSLHGADIVSVVEKESKSCWSGMESRTDVRIQWRKAWQKGLS